MKALFVIITFIISTNSFGQNDSIFPFVGGNWYQYNWHHNTVTGQLDEIYHDLFFFYGDTVIDNGQKRHLIVDIAQSDTLGSIRIDGDKWYFKAHNGSFTYGFGHTYHGTGDTLLYDFGLLIGDTVLLEDNSGFYYHTVTNIDTITLDNQLRKRLIFSDGDHWIYGIGSTKGLLHPISTEFELGHKLCYFSGNYQNGIGQSYSINTDGSSSNCDFYFNSVSDFEPSKNIILYPNPTTSHFQIKSDQISQGKLQIFNLNGALIKQFHFSSQTNFDMSDLTQGLYSIQLISDNRVYSSKLMKLDE